MDPNQTIKDILAYLEIATIAGRNDDKQEALFALRHVRESLDGLDEWLAHGGFIPTLSFHYRVNSD